MRILHIISSGGMYGAEAVILNLSRTLNEQGHTSLLGIFSNTSNPNLQLHERALAESIESHLIPCRGQIDRAVPASIRALASATNADLIHAHGYKADVYAYLAMRKTPTPLVSTCHTWYDDNRLVWLYGVIDRRVLQRYQAVIAVSDEVRQRLLDSGVQTNRIRFVRNGIDLRPFTNATPSLRHLGPEGALIVGWVGRLTHDKGPDLFLRAIAQLRSEFPTARYLMVGQGPHRPQVEQLIGDLAIGDIVYLLGQRSDMPAVYASCDLMVSSSRLEGLPMAILEGMASALPWVAPAVGAIPMVIRNGQNGILISPDNADLLATNMARMMRASEERANMGAAGRRLTESEFSAARMSEDYLSIYKDVTIQSRNPDAIS
ncbi:MAG: glycosyltransferase family 4 protein [Acidobacteriaceae bacterium]